jgi:hypothetical protein
MGMKPAESTGLLETSACAAARTMELVVRTIADYDSD